MADLEKTVSILFNGVDNVSDTIKKIGSATDKMASGLEDVGAPFASAAEKVALLEGALLAVGAAGLKARSDMEAEATKMANALGLPTEKAEEFEEVAKRVYTSGFGEDLSDAFSAVTTAAQKFSDESVSGIEDIVKNATKLNTTFGIEIPDAMSGVKTLMDNFGLSSEEAFNFITAGFQKGLDGSGDFIESINEYATQFKNGGADAGEFFSVLESGFQGGVLGTDKAADAFKEFNVRILDGSKTTSEALAQIGLGDEFTDSLARGEISAIDAFGTVIRKLGEVDDKSVVMQAGVGLIGTQFEDLGTEAALALSTTATSMDDLKGKIDSLDPNESLGKKFTSLARTITTTITDADIWDGMEDELKAVVDRMKKDFVAAWGDLGPEDFQGMLGAFDGLFASFGDALEDAGLDLTSSEGIKAAIQDVIDSIESITTVSAGIVDIVGPVVGLFADLTREFNSLSPEAKKLAGQVVGIGSALSVVAGALSIGGGILGGLSTLAGFVSTGGPLAAGLAGIVAVLSGPVGIAAALGVATAAIVSFMNDGDVKTWADNLTKYMDKAAQAAATDAQNIGNSLFSLEEPAGQAADAIKKIPEELGKIPETTTTEITAEADEAALKRAAEWFKEEVPEETVTKVKVDVDGESIGAATQKLEYFVEGERFEIEVPVDVKGVDDAKKAIDKLPSEKILEIKAQGDIDVQLAQIAATAETIQSAFEFKAQVDIAEIEAAAETTLATFDSINQSIVSTGELIASALGILNDPGSLQAKWEALDILDQEQKLREETFKLQKGLTEAQIKYLEARTKAMNQGDLAIEIDSSGLEPALEMVMWEIIKKVQVRANAESADFLLGLGAV